MPEINRFRRGYSFEKSRANESLFGASAFAEFLTYMASLREGSRGEEVTAMGGWQWGWGWRDGEDRFFTTLRSVQNDMLGCEGGWVPAYARTTGGGWVPASVITGEGCPRGKGDGIHASARTTGGWVPDYRHLESRLSVGGWGWVPASARTTGGGWVPASVFARAGSLWGDGDGSPPPAFAGAGSRREDNGRAGGRAVREPPLRKENIVGYWVHPHPPSSRGQALTFPHQGGRDL